MQVNATGRLSGPEQFGDIVVRSDPASGAIVRMKDIARIELGALQYSSTAVFGKDRPSCWPCTRCRFERAGSAAARQG